MKLTSLTLENFGPYRGRHEIDLSVTPDAPVIIIYGENMFGKTSLVNALRWGLYETALDRRNIRMPLKELVNYHEADEGNWTMSVGINFVHEDAQYALNRQVQARSVPVNDADFEIVKSLRVDQHFLPVQDVDERIASILHRDISDFFLFDGEVLNKYEDLVADDEGSAVAIRRSIEQILGLPALTLARSDASELHRAAGRRQTQALRASGHEQDLAESADRLRDQLESLETEEDQLAALLSADQAEKERLRAERQRFAEVAAEANELLQIEDQISEQDTRRQQLKEETAEIISRNWWIPLASQAVTRLDELEALVLEATRSQADLVEADALRRALVDEICPTCLTRLDDAHRDAIRIRVGEIQQDDGDVDGERLLELQVAIRSVRVFADGAAPREYIVKSREIRRLRIGINRLRRRADAIHDDLRGHDAAEISSLEHQYDEVVERISRESHQIREVLAQKEEAQTELRRVETQIRRLTTIDPGLAAEVSALETVLRIFDSAIGRFRERVRINVERDATEIFRRLTTAPDLDSLRINEQYGLRILDRTGREITTRSAGAEQVVALSLIGALNWCAVREGPIVMDTPFGRLDQTHRRNILEFVPRFGPQVVLLVQSGEFERERDREFLGSAIAREYEIRHVDGRTTQSEVVPLA